MKEVKLKEYKRLFAAEAFSKDFLDTINEKTMNKNNRYVKWLKKSLKQLDTLGKAAIKLNGFEQLETNNPKLYSIRYPKSKLNPRVIYIHFDDAEKITLLTSFKEKSNKDYSQGIARAKERLKTLNAQEYEESEVCYEI